MGTKRSHVLIRQALSLAVGFAISFAIFGSLRAKRPTSETGGASAAVTEPEKTPLRLESEGLGWRDADYVRLQSSLGGRRSEEIGEALENVLLTDGEARRPLLALLLGEWALRDARVAMEWMLAHTTGDERAFLYREISRLWAESDVSAFAKWFPEFFAREDSPAFGYFAGTRDLIVRRDPMLYARMMEEPPMRVLGTSSWGGQMLAGLIDVETARRYIGTVQERISYEDEPPSSTLANTPGHAGWNLVAESAAQRWHLEDPAGCEAWLATLSERAQTHIRFAIRSNELEIANKAKADSPPVAGGPIDPGVAPSTAGAPKDDQQWAAWWRREPDAAEAFLKAVDWPDAVKFRARAEAYVSPP